MAAWIGQKRGKLTVRWKYQGRGGSKRVPDRETAKTLVRHINRLHALGKDYRPRDDKNTATLGEIIGKHLNSEARLKSDKTIKNKETALISYIRFLRVKRPRGRLMPNLVDEQSIEQYYDHLIARNLSHNTARHYATAVKTFWKWAEQSRDYGDFFERYREPELPRAKKSNVTKSPTWSQLDTLIKQELTDGPYPQYVKLMIFQRYTGLRVKQASLLLWSDIDIDGKRIRIRPELGKSALEKSGRIIPATPHLFDELATWGRREGLILCPNGRDNGLHVESIRKAVVRAWKRSPIDPALYQRQTNHAFRKAFTSELVRRGADRWAIEVMLGRSTGLGGDVYTDPAFVWDSMLKASALVSKIGDDVAIDIRHTQVW